MATKRLVVLIQGEARSRVAGRHHYVLNEPREASAVAWSWVRCFVRGRTRAECATAGCLHAGRTWWPESGWPLRFHLFRWRR